MKKSKNFWVIVLLTSIVGILFCFGLGLYFFSARTQQTLNSNSTSSLSFEIYFVHSNISPLESLAQDVAQDEMRLDFAGYVWQNKEDFFTILSAHKTKNEAILTQCNLIEQGKDVEILQHSFPTFSLSQTLTEKEKNIFTKSINSFYDTYLKLYDLSISLDTKLENELEIQEKIEKLLTEFEEVFVSFKTIFPANSNKTLTNLNDALLYFVECLSLLNKKEYKTQTQTYSSLIKHTYVEILDIYNDFINSINS